VLQVTVRLLDGTVHHVLVAKGATVKDVLVALRRIVGVKADADFSLALRSITPEGHDQIACLPDVMSAEEAEALGAMDNRMLVYKRRIYLPPLSGADAEAAEVARQKSEAAGAERAVGSGGGIYYTDLPFDLPDVDAEAAAAKGVTDAAHMLLYIEASFHVARGYYLLPLADCVILAGLAMISLKGRVTEAEAAAIAALPNPRAGLDAYKAALPQIMSAQAIAEHKATSGQPVEDLLVRSVGCGCPVTSESSCTPLPGRPCAAGCSGICITRLSLHGLSPVCPRVGLLASSLRPISAFRRRRSGASTSACLPAWTPWLRSACTSSV